MLSLLALFHRNFSSLITYMLVSFKRRALVSEPGYYILKANENTISRLLLRVYYDE